MSEQPTKCRFCGHELANETHAHCDEILDALASGALNTAPFPDGLVIAPDDGEGES